MRLIAKFLCAAAAAVMLCQAPSAQTSSNFLPKVNKVPPIESAVQVSVAKVEKNQVRVDLIADPALYVYRDKLQFKAGKGATFSTLKPKLPQGTRVSDEFFGEVDVLRGPQSVVVPIKGNARGALVVELVACHAEAKVCYPPYQVTLPLGATPSGALKKTEKSPNVFEKTDKSPEKVVIVKTNQELDQALRASAGKFVIVDFWATWCVPCKQMEKTTFVDPEVKALMESEFTLIKVDVSATGHASSALLKRYGFAGPPGFAFYGKDGKEIGGGRLMGYIAPERFLAQLKLVRA